MRRGKNATKLTKAMSSVNPRETNRTLPRRFRSSEIAKNHRSDILNEKTTLVNKIVKIKKLNGIFF